MLANHRLNLAIVVVLAGCCCAQAEDHLKWQPNLETAQRLAAQSNRLILIHFGAPWCKPCTKLEQDVLSKPELAAALEPNFVCVKLNVDETPGTARMYGVSSIPTDVIITPTGKLVSAQPSAPTVNQYSAQMTQIADGHKKLQQGAYAQVRANATVTPAIQTVANTTASATAPVVQQGAYSDDRYADYFKNKPQTAAGVPAPVGAPQQQFAAAPQVPVPNYPAQPSGAPAQQQTTMPPQQAAAPPQQAAAPPYQPYAPQSPEQAKAQLPSFQYPAQPPAAQQSAAQPPAAQPPAAQPPVQQRVATAPAVQLPAGSPPLGLDGNCPVQLIEQKRWVRGDVRFGAVHRGRTYLFTGVEEQNRFLANPDAFSPVISGNDPVLALDHAQEVAGRREHGVFFNNQIYLFSGEASLQRFNQNPNRYAGQVMQAMRPSQTTNR